MLLLFDKPFLLRSLFSHRSRECHFSWPRNNVTPKGCNCNPCYFLQDVSLVADVVQSAHPNLANRTKTRSSMCVAMLHPGTAMCEWSRSWEPRGAQLRQAVVPQMR